MSTTSFFSVKTFFTLSRKNASQGYAESASSGWKSKTKLSDGWNWFFEFNRNGSCYDHMYGDTYGFLDITSNGHSGNALRDTITGGLATNSTNAACGSPLGTQLYNRESYTGLSQVYTGGKIGHSYIYFKKADTIGVSRNTAPYVASAGSNRFSLYVYLPPTTSNGTGGYNNELQQTYQLGLFVDPSSTGSHHYINFYTQGGGWAKYQVEETSNGDNSGDGATRYIPNFLQTIWQFYFTTLPYSGIATPPYEVKIDDIEFSADTYSPQNNETISNIAILYKDSTKTWEVSLNDKYKNANAMSTYEIRYAFSPITNENWGSATPATIIADSRFSIQARTDGKFQKWWPYYQGVWAPFRLSDTDTNSLSPGKIVYFAIKDISQVNNTSTPTDGINGYWGVSKGGRPYNTDTANFNFTKDGPVLPLIKRISYSLALSTTAPIAAPKNVSGTVVKP